jgi:hypothetical protein
VNVRLDRRLRKSWHLFRRRHLAPEASRLPRLVVEKTRWLHDACSPVMLMVDDLTNAWHSRSGGQLWDPGGDWGGGLSKPGSALLFLKDGLLREFPEIKVTFFTVAGRLSAYTHHQPFSFSAPLDADEESRRFFGSLSKDPRFELAYHGFDHGSPGATTESFLQEWRGFESREAAIAQTMRGLEIFRRATGSVPRGGKYGGWDYNTFADAAVNDCGFLWWCRDWTPRDVTGRIPDHYYEPQFFGSNLVVALPSTVHGQFWDRRQIDLLLDRRQLIAVEEHIAAVRPDGLTQTPNIVDDLEELRGLFRYLQRKPVWHATGSEIASYVVARERTVVCDVSQEGFSLRYEGHIEGPMLTLSIDCSVVCSPSRPLIEVIAPGGEKVDPLACRFDTRTYRHLVTVPVSTGRYGVRPREE